MATFNILFNKVSAPLPGTSYADVKTVKSVSLRGKKMPSSYLNKIGVDSTKYDYFFIKSSKSNSYGNIWLICTHGRYGDNWDICQMSKDAEIICKDYNNIVVNYG